ncbi:unnamed protein product [Absidia cylindrospora]
MDQIKLLALCFVLFTGLILAHDNHQKSQLFLEVSQKLKASDIISTHSHVDETKAHNKQFGHGNLLAYVTPWNNKGYDVVKKFKGKFDYVSPVWYNVQRNYGEHIVTGEHDVDEHWMEQVRYQTDSGHMVGLIVPRFQFLNWQVSDYQAFISDTEEQKRLYRLIVAQTRKHNFDGIVLECGFPVPLMPFVKSLADVLHQIEKQLILVLPPLRKGYQSMVDANTFSVLSTFVDRFSLMTYDYSSYLPNGGPNAPTDWIVDNIEELTNKSNRYQLLVGLNLYAMSYLPPRPPQPLLMQQVLEKLTTSHDTLNDDDDEDSGSNIIINWDKESEEHHFEDLDEDGIMQGTIWMPSIKSLQRRIHLAEDYQVGLSLWEVGQGLDYFYELF